MNRKLEIAILATLALQVAIVVLLGVMVTNQGKCPDCGGQLLKGPRGGAAINVMCEKCRHEFNICGPFGAERIDRMR